MTAGPGSSGTERITMISLDTETTGLDLRHAARPFFVSTCAEDGVVRCWEWEVDPVTREVRVLPGDRDELNDLLRDADEIVGHNVKFDATALASVGVGPWPWEKTHDTTLLSHLLASNQPKDLTSLALLWLGEDILPLEKRLRETVVECRRSVAASDFYARHGTWQTAKPEHPGLPSGGGAGADYWLPAAYARAVGLPETDRRWTVLSDYAARDAEVTLLLYQVMSAEVRRRGHWRLYEERRRLPRVCAVMENNSLTLSVGASEDMRKGLVEESMTYAARCQEIADGYGYQLEFPKGAVNNNLRTFCFEVLRLEPVRNPKAKTAAPSLDAKTAIPHYLATLPEDTPQGRFVRAMVGKRSRDNGLAFLRSWHSFAMPHEGTDTHLRLYPTFNPASTDTLRLSSERPNAQQVGKKTEDAAGVPIAVLRRAFGPAPGREWWSIDFTNIELRIPAYLSGERDLIDLFERADEPPFYGSEHLLNFSVVYEDIWAKAVREVGIDKAGPYIKKTYAGSYYKDCKNGDFAVQYQAGDETADRTFRRPGARRKLKERFGKKEAVIARTLAFANRMGYVETLPDATVDPDRGYPLMTSRNERGYVKPTLPFSYVVQGTAGWIGNRAAVRVLDQLEEWNQTTGKDDYRLIAYVHDELLFDFPKRADPWVDPRRSNLVRIRIIQRLMESGGADLRPAIPITAAVEYHPNNWGEGIAV